jgi:D-alanyl-D-alanine dipeptidase
MDMGNLFGVNVLSFDLENIACEGGEMSQMPSDFVDLSTLPNVRLDIRYAGDTNFMGRKVEGYDASLCWMHRDGAEKLQTLAERLEMDGLGLHIWDAYRPRRATQDMIEWAESTGQEWLIEQGYLVRDSRHNRGGAIDLSFYNLETGELLDMGTDWDFFGVESHAFEVSGPALDNRLLLRSSMQETGFVPYDVEWWHFELPNAAELPVVDVPYTTGVT